MNYFAERVFHFLPQNVSRTVVVLQKVARGLYVHQQTRRKTDSCQHQTLITRPTSDLDIFVQKLRPVFFLLFNTICCTCQTNWPHSEFEHNNTERLQDVVMAIMRLINLRVLLDLCLSTCSQLRMQ